MSELKEFTVQAARPLPVILLLDVSGSMSGGKINNLNAATKEMIQDFANEEAIQAEIHTSIITFEDNAHMHTPMQPASKVVWQDMQTGGMTSLGAALDMAKNLIEDKSVISSRAYRPAVILVSDGQPNDSGWEQKMNSFIKDGRTAKCDRFAMGIGADADENMLKLFINNPERKVFQATDAAQIKKFFKFITMSTVTRTRSVDPNQAPVIPSIDEFDPFA